MSSDGAPLHCYCSSMEKSQCSRGGVDLLVAFDWLLRAAFGWGHNCVPGKWEFSYHSNRCACLLPSHSVHVCVCVSSFQGSHHVAIVESLRKLFCNVKFSVLFFLLLLSSNFQVFLVNFVSVCRHVSLYSHATAVSTAAHLSFPLLPSSSHAAAAPFFFLIFTFQSNFCCRWNAILLSTSAAKLFFFFFFYPLYLLQVQQTMKENLVAIEENFASLDQRMKKL